MVNLRGKRKLRWCQGGWNRLSWLWHQHPPNLHSKLSRTLPPQSKMLAVDAESSWFIVEFIVAVSLWGWYNAQKPRFATGELGTSLNFGMQMHKTTTTIFLLDSTDSNDTLQYSKSALFEKLFQTTMTWINTYELDIQNSTDDRFWNTKRTTDWNMLRQAAFFPQDLDVRIQIE